MNSVLVLFFCAPTLAFPQSKGESKFIKNLLRYMIFKRRLKKVQESTSEFTIMPHLISPHLLSTHLISPHLLSCLTWYPLIYYHASLDIPSFTIMPHLISPHLLSCLTLYPLICYQCTCYLFCTCKYVAIKISRF